MPRGGRRIGAGRKPKQQTAKLLQHPSAPQHAPTTSSGPSVPTTSDPSPLEEFDAPDDLTMEERAIWLKQAPHAFANRTLTRASALAFERYCKLVVGERNEAKSSGLNGPNHRGLLRLLRDLELQFMLAPAGKAMPMSDLKAGAIADPDDLFFGGANAGGR